MNRFSWAFSTLVIFALAISAWGPTPTATALPKPTATTAPGALQPANLLAQPTQAPAQSILAAAQSGAQAKQLVMALDLDLVVFDPHRAFEDTYLIIGGAIYESLTQLDPKDPSRVIPLLAEKWDISRDGKVYTFTLKKGVKFSTGSEMTSADVKFSMDRLQNVKGNPAFLMDGIKQVDAPDPYTVKFTLATPDASFLARTSAIYMAVIDSREAKAHGATSEPGADKSDQAKAWMDDHTIGTGPYVLEKWTRNAEVRLAPNPYAWLKPNFSSVVIKQVKDPTAQAQMLERGDVDIAMNIDPDRAKQLKTVPGVKIEQGMSPTLIVLGMTANPNISPIVANKKFRQAVAWAIDYDGLDKQLLADNAVTPPSILPYGFLGADTVPGFKRDLAKAKSLLAESGYKPGTKVTLSYPNTTLFGVDRNVVAQKLQADLLEAGITLELVPQEQSLFLQNYRGQKDMIAMGWQTPDFPDSHANAWGFGATDGIFSKRLFYMNRDNDKLVAQGLEATDPKARAAAYAKLLKNIQDDANFIALVQPKENIAYRDYIKGLFYHPVVKVPITAISK
jgi:peptide/nickel transport system substrate-binding protein